MSIAKWSFSAAALLLFGASLASAQTSFDVNLGFGSAWDSANGGGIDNAASLNAFGSCTVGSGDANCQSLPKLNGFFLGFGGDLMFNKHLGAGFEASLQPSQESYGPLNSRQTFYDVNAIYAPVTTKRASLLLEGGIGGARTSFSLTQSGCVGTAVCSTSTEPVGAANHFQVHVGVGVQIFLTEHIFIKPEFDLHYVPGLTNQFGSNAVPEGLLWVGYSFGER
jgi:opacity protein-like surface antigen